MNASRRNDMNTSHLDKDTTPNKGTENQLHTYPLVRRRTSRPAALLMTVLASLALAATARAEEGSGDPNDYTCHGAIRAGTPEVGSSEPQVKYTFNCSGPITGYQLQSQIPLTGFQASPLVSEATSGEPTSDSFSCGGEAPGYAVNCVGATNAGYEKILGEFAIDKPVCAEPRVDPLLTVTYAYLEKGVVTQAISGPFDLGRPLHCPADGYNAGTRLAPNKAVKAKTGKHKKHKPRRHKRNTKK
jgi:hypothetical protein